MLRLFEAGGVGECCKIQPKEGEDKSSHSKDRERLPFLPRDTQFLHEPATGDRVASKT